MIAEGSLRNPALFTGENPVVWDISLEYIDFVRKYPCPVNYVRGHVFKMCHHALCVHQEARAQLADAKNLEEVAIAVRLLARVCRDSCDHLAKVDDTCTLPFRHWICQPYVRPLVAPVKEVAEPAPAEETAVTDVPVMSKKQMKRLLKRKHAPQLDGLLSPNEKAERLLAFKHERKKTVWAKCVNCGNVAASKCVFESCKRCCKRRALEVRTVSCHLHKVYSEKEEQHQLNKSKRPKVAAAAAGVGGGKENGRNPSSAEEPPCEK